MERLCNDCKLNDPKFNVSEIAKALAWLAGKRAYTEYIDASGRGVLEDSVAPTVGNAAVNCKFNRTIGVCALNPENRSRGVEVVIRDADCMMDVNPGWGLQEHPRSSIDHTKLPSLDEMRQRCVDAAEAFYHRRPEE